MRHRAINGEDWDDDLGPWARSKSAHILMRLWEHRAAKVSTPHLAWVIDPYVRISSLKDPARAIFVFADDSVLWTQGTGKSFKMWIGEDHVPSYLTQSYRRHARAQNRTNR